MNWFNDVLSQLKLGKTHKKDVFINSDFFKMKFKRFNL